MLDQTGISYTRIDGKTSLPKRSQALRAFQCDDFIRVILVSITCGGAGLVIFMNILGFPITDLSKVSISPLVLEFIFSNLTGTQ